jgi:adenine-specific DNA-methyltransferase
MSSAGGCPSRQKVVSVGTSVVPPGPCPPPADTPGPSTAVTTPQVTASIHDFAVSLGARDWKYNNNFVDVNDTYRHSKWLSFMEKRLRLARALLKPDGVLIVTIGEDELNHLGVLLERKDLFADALRETVTICINPGGATGEGLSRVEEYAIFCFLGGARPVPVLDDMLVSEAGSETHHTTAEGVRWEWLMRSGNAWYRQSRRNLCYPILLNADGTRIVRAGDPWTPPTDDAGNVDESVRPETIDGHPVAWPVRRDGKLGIWRVDSARLNWLAEQGYAYVSRRDDSRGTWTIMYLMTGTIEAIEADAIEVTGRDADTGRVTLDVHERKAKTAKTMWHRGRHTAGGAGGTQLLNALLGERNVFPFPKLVYATRDCLEIAVGDRQDALILDFFAGSGTTLHATCLLNSADEGMRRCVLVTNNEVDDQLARKLHKQGLYAGDPDYDRYGIFEAACRPRCEAAITGVRPDGEPATGRYLGGGAYADGFRENCMFLRIDYLEPDDVELGYQFEAIVPILWLTSGGLGPLPDPTLTDGYLLPPASPFAVLLRESAFRRFAKVLESRSDVSRLWLVTDSERAFADMRAALPGDYSVSMLYRDYLRNFAINTVSS